MWVCKGLAPGVGFPHQFTGTVYPIGEGPSITREVQALHTRIKRTPADNTACFSVVNYRSCLALLDESHACGNCASHLLGNQKTDSELRCSNRDCYILIEPFGYESVLFPSLNRAFEAQSAMGLREILLPREKIFFELLEMESNNVMQGAQVLRDVVLHYESLPEKRGQMKDIEHRGDEIVHQIYEQLAKTFVTPLDREEIAKLASLYDDVLDYMEGVVNRLYLYEIDKPTETMRKFADLVPKTVEEIHFAFAAIHEIRAPGIEARCNEVDRLEKQADDVLHESVAALFKSHDPLAIMKLKEIYELTETITDKCADVVQAIRNIILEYS